MFPPELDELDDLEQSDESEAPAGSGGKLARWLVLLGFGILFAAVYQIGLTLRMGQEPMQEQLMNIQATLSMTPPLEPTQQAETTRLAQLHDDINELSDIEATLYAVHIDWPSVMSIVSSFDQAEINVTGLSQSGSVLLLTGSANDEDIIMSYTDLLRESNQFTSVAIQSIAFREMPTATPLPADAVAPVAQAQTAFAEFTLELHLKTGSAP